MADSPAETLEAQRVERLDKPLRVVLFGGGPLLERGTEQFICRLADSTEIDFVGAFCQSQGQSMRVIFQDLWQRRRFLAFPLLLMQIGDRLARYLTHPRSELAIKRRMSMLSDRIHSVKDIHADEVLEQVRALNADLGLIYGSPILKPELFEIPRLGTLGIHHGKVPEYRGKKTSFWAIHNGEASAGITIQKVNAGLDTGEIVLTGEVPIGKRTPAAVWNDLEALGVDLYIQAILAVRNGSATFKPQVGKKGRLYRDPNTREIFVVWWRQIMKGVGLGK